MNGRGPTVGLGPSSLRGTAERVVVADARRSKLYHGPGFFSRPPRRGEVKKEALEIEGDALKDLFRVRFVFSHDIVSHKLRGLGDALRGRRRIS
jgi:hypothetical protein